MPPITRTWIGATSGAFNVSTNWLGGVVPLVTDHLVFDRGTRDLDAHSVAFALGNIVTTSGYKGRIAPVGSFDLAGGAASINHASGSANYEGNVASVKLKPLQGAKINLVAGIWTKLFAELADLSVQASGSITTMRAKDSTIDDVGGAAYALCELKGTSRLKTKRGGRIIAKAGSIVDIFDSGVLSSNSLIQTMAVLNYFSNATISGLIEVEDNGVFDASANANAFSYPGTLAVWPGAIYDLNTVSGKVDPATFESYGLSASSNAGRPSLI